MLFFDVSLLLDYTLQYSLSNFSCLFYGLDTLSMKYLFFAGYYDLLVDISEGFGIWIALLVLTTSSLTLTVSIQQTNAPTILGLKSITANTLKTNSATLLAYRNFLRYIPQNK